MEPPPVDRETPSRGDDGNRGIGDCRRRTRSLEVLEVLCREKQVKDEHIWRMRLLTREIEMRTKVLEEWMYPERAQRGRGDPDASTWWGRQEFKDGNNALAKGVVIKVVRSTMEGHWRPVMRSLEENEQPDDVPVMGSRYWMSRVDDW